MSRKKSLSILVWICVGILFCIQSYYDHTIIHRQQKQLQEEREKQKKTPILYDQKILLHNVDQLYDKIHKKESFVLYMYGEQCPDTHKIEQKLQEILKENHLFVYALDALKDNTRKTFNETKPKEISELKTIPSFYIFKDGKMTKKLDGEEWMVSTCSSEKQNNSTYQVDYKKIESFLQEAKK